MTSLVLLLWISAGLALQLGIYLGIGFWRHWLDYQAMRSGVAELGWPVRQDVSGDVGAVAVAAWPGFRSFRVERKVTEDAAQSVSSFYLVPEDAQALPTFRPGQFLTFRLDMPTTTGGSEQILRCYSLSDAPSPDAYRISIKRLSVPAGSKAPPGRSSTYFHDQVAVGSLLQVRAPAGHFHIERSAAPVVLIGGGIGITPMLSMLTWCLMEQPKREIWLFYGVRDGRELVMKARLEALAAVHPDFRLRFCFSNPLSAEVAGQDYQHRGRIDVQLLRAELPLKPYHFYICGPAALMEGLVPALEDWGVPDARIHFEAFGPASIRRRQAVSLSGTSSQSEATTNAADDNGIVVSFAQSGKQFSWQPATGSLLEFAEANGVAVNSGCRAGGCGSCQTTIRTGEVSYAQAPDFDPEPGTCLLCVCTPKTSVTLEA